MNRTKNIVLFLFMIKSNDIMEISSIIDKNISNLHVDVKHDIIDRLVYTDIMEINNIITYLNGKINIMKSNICNYLNTVDLVFNEYVIYLMDLKKGHNNNFKYLFTLDYPIGHMMYKGVYDININCFDDDIFIRKKFLWK